MLEENQVIGYCNGRLWRDVALLKCNLILPKNLSKRAILSVANFSFFFPLMALRILLAMPLCHWHKPAQRAKGYDCVFCLVREKNNSKIYSKLNIAHLLKFLDIIKLHLNTAMHRGGLEGSPI